MEWTKLELRKASVLRKEVDLAIRLIQQAVENDDQSGLDDLMESIKQRIHEIEEFYAENDEDDRAILLEKQRLRLRRAIQALKPEPKTPATVNSPSPGQPSPNIHHQGAASAVGSNRKNKGKERGSGGSVASRASSKVSQLSGIGRRSPGALKPIYSWEMGSQGLEQGEGTEGTGGLVPEVLRDRLYTEEYGAFIPTGTQGLYMREEGEEFEDYHGGGGGLPEGHMDFQVVLSPSEFEAYVSRRNIAAKKLASAANSHAAKYLDSKCKETRFLRTQTPYVDPKRVLKELYRPPQPEKWVDPKGFNTTIVKHDD